MLGNPLCEPLLLGQRVHLEAAAAAAARRLHHQQNISTGQVDRNHMQKWPIQASFLHSRRSQGAGKSDTVFSAQSPQVKCMIAGGSSSTTTPLYQTRAKRCHGPTEGCEGWIHCYWKDHLASALVRYQLGLMEKLCRVRQTNKWGRLAELKEASCSRPTRSWMSSPSYHIGHRQNNRADPWQE